MRNSTIAQKHAHYLRSKAVEPEKKVEKKKTNTTHEVDIENVDVEALNSDSSSNSLMLMEKLSNSSK